MREAKTISAPNCREKSFVVKLKRAHVKGESRCIDDMILISFEKILKNIKIQHFLRHNFSTYSLFDVMKNQTVSNYRLKSRLEIN